MMKVKCYKCPECHKKFKTLNGWGNHMDSTHPSNRPEGYSTSRFFYYVMTGKTHGVCRTCKGDTPWNEGSMKYDQYCTNPECKKAYVKIAKSRMIGKYGKVHLLNDPNMQKKMLQNRKISGKYKFEDGTEFEYVGSYEKAFLEMLDKMMDWHTNDIISPSPHTYYYNYKNSKDDPKNEGVKFYIPDFYIPSLNLEIEIKQQTSTNQAMNDINRVKERLKDEVMNSNKEVNYIKINDNDFTKFFEFILKAKEYIPTPENIRKNQMDMVMESLLVNKEKEISIEIAQEGLLSFLTKKKDPNEFKTASWKDIFRIKNLIGFFPLYTGAKIVDGMIEVRGINYALLQNRIVKFYDDKSINNIFIPKYNALSYRRFERKKIQRKDIKIDYLYTPEFFALELVRLFTDLGTRFRDKIYLSMANQIYQNSWLFAADRKSINAPLLSTERLGNISLQLNDYQKEFIEKYPKLKAQLNLNGYILAFEQGLGKTLTATALSECLKADHVYIVCPNSLKENWALEIRKYYNKYSDTDLWRQEVFICSDKPIYFNPNTTKFMIINNESIEKMYPYVLGGKNMLILDESHNFRNIKSKRVAQLIKLRDLLKCSDTLIMSGTPIKATPDEIVPALMMIDPTFTMTAAQCFAKAFKLHSSLGTSLVQTRFGKIMYRKEKDVLGNTLPEKHILPFEVSTRDASRYIMTNVNTLVKERFSHLYDTGIEEAMKLRKPFLDIGKEYSLPNDDYDRFVTLIDLVTRKDSSLHEIDQMFMEKYMQDVLSRIKKTDLKHEYVRLTKEFVRFKSHCLGVAFGEILPKYRRDMFISMYEDNKSTFIKMINECPKKTLIFSQFKDVVNHIYEDLNNNGIGTVIITGEVKDRMTALREFKENDSIRVLVATSQTIGTGVTLTEASQMFFFGPPWRQSDFDQCSDRIHRIGQTDEVYIYTVILQTPELNLSTRMDDILTWSKKMTESVISTTDDSDNLEETKFEEILTTESCVPASEGYVFTKEDKVQKLDEFESGKENILLITGLSRSGKTTLGNELSEKYNAMLIEIDAFEDFDTGYFRTRVMPYQNIIDAYFATPEGKKYKNMILTREGATMEKISKCMAGCVKFVIDYCKKSGDRYIIEGIQIYSDCDPKYVTQFPLIIKGTSMIKSFSRRNTKNFKQLKFYLNEERKVNTLRQSIAIENLVFSKKPTQYLVNDFINGYNNVLLITGLSGSGKSTLAEEYAKRYNAEWVELDWFEKNYNMTEDQLKECAEPLYIYLTHTPDGKKFRKLSMSENKPSGNDLTNAVKLFGNWLMKWCETHKDKKWILEGVQIYSCFDFENVKKYPMIILNTSTAKSISQKVERDGASEFIKMRQWYNDETKILKNFKKEIAKESYVMVENRDLLREFLCQPEKDTLTM